VGGNIAPHKPRPFGSRSTEPTNAPTDKGAVKNNSVVILLHVKAQLNRLVDSQHQLIERSGLGMAAVELWNGSNVESVFVALDHDIVLSSRALD
jgi:hypothetical protein